MTQFDECYRTLFVDFHNPEFPEDSFRSFDSQKYFQTMLRVRPSEIMVWTNDHYGSCFYNTDVGHKHSRLKGDYFGELAALAHEHGIRICAYISIGWHNRNAREHPDWRQLDEKGEAVKTGQWYRVCMNSPHRDFALAMLRELSEKYRPDSFWLDILQTPRFGCHCTHCQEKFKAIFGAEMSFSSEPFGTDLKRLREFRRITRHDFIADARKVIKGINPDAVVMWNGGGNPFESDVESDSLIDKLSLERQDWTARWLRNLGKPFEILIKRGCYHWSDWTLAPLAYHKTAAATILASGGMLHLGDAGVPNGTLQEGVYDQLSEVFSFIESLEPFIKGASSVPNIAVLHSVKSNLLSEWVTPPDAPSPMGFRMDQLPHLRGLYRLLVESHCHFDIIPEEKLSQLERYKLLILPDQLHLSDSEADLIRKYVRDGGRIIASFRTGMYGADGEELPQSVLADAFGVSFHGKPPYSVGYILPEGELARGLPDIPLVVSPLGIPGRIRKHGAYWGGYYARPESAKRLAQMVDPRIERSEKQWVSHGQAEPYRVTDFAAASLNSYGSGKAVYISYPVFRAHLAANYPLLAQFLRHLITLVCPDEVVKVTSEGPLDVTLNKRPGEYILHLIATDPRDVAQIGSAADYHRPTYDVCIDLEAPAAKTVSLPLKGNSEVAFKKKNGRITFTIPKVDVHELVLIR